MNNPTSPPAAAQESGRSSDAQEKQSFIAGMKERLHALFVPEKDATIKEALEEAIEEVLEDREDGQELAPEEKTMLRNVLSFGELTVQDIMTTRSYISAVSIDITLDALKRHIIDQRHTRVPVFKGSLDHIEGFLHVKDMFAVLAGDQPYDLRKLLRPMLFVPPSMKIVDLLVKMRRSASHVAIVVDEYGGTDGLVTLEDVSEEIVGDIKDEHDEEESAREFMRVSANMFEADARVPIERIESELAINLLAEHEEEEFDTLGGLIFFELGRVPMRGEVIKHASGLQFEIMEADPRRIRRVRIIRPASD